MSEYDFDYYDAETGEGLYESELETRYDDMLDEIHGDFMDSYPASRVLREVDPIAYRCGYNDWLDSELVNGVITEEDPLSEDDDTEEV